MLLLLRYARVIATTMIDAGAMANAARLPRACYGFRCHDAYAFMLPRYAITG